ncbi:Arginine/lysine/ornithine decarboxylase [Evansella caseinilytica]|uniref:Arginine/lysine/ornithine decarboxylase n=1 Tax=Evansella caseinilytica TaxID=1503961 RepID=A0A1H3UXA9_9BACI|nr:aminotransferase class V-fold PLP-dependent enzyme [Evansella caseinilytica]SDZ66621.1 Arginine/lysine/ornithine decarboxylase [Evansella caseinilytica]
MDQNNTPLFDRLVKHVDEKNVSFHVPGHKNGAYFFTKGHEHFRHILQLDVTEITGMDDLHSPVSVIQEAQLLTADLYRVKASCFLIGGSTVGNLAMIMSSVRRGDKLLLQRNCHQSVFHAAELSGAKTVYIEPEVDGATQLPLGVSLASLEEAISRHGDAKAIVLTSPTYEGYSQPLHEHVSAAHQAGMLALVDEAHGAHLLFDDSRWPVSAIRAGADVVVQSAHKMLPAMTMASYLHINSDKVDEDRLRHYLKLLQSSSPSYPLMASLDLARAYLAGMLAGGAAHLTAQIKQLREQVGNGKAWTLSPESLGNYVQDPLKLAFLSNSRRGMTQEWQRRMEGLQAYPELVSPHHLLLTLPLTNKSLPLEGWSTIIREALEVDCSNQGEQPGLTAVRQQRDKLSEPVMTISAVDAAQKERVDWKASPGRIAAETITPYPPGIPLLVKGERIQEHHIEELVLLVENNFKFQTGDAWMNEGISVVKNR